MFLWFKITSLLLHFLPQQTKPPNPGCRRGTTRADATARHKSCNRFIAKLVICLQILGHHLLTESPIWTFIATATGWGVTPKLSFVLKVGLRVSPLLIPRVYHHPKEPPFLQWWLTSRLKTSTIVLSGWADIFDGRCSRNEMFPMIAKHPPAHCTVCGSVMRSKCDTRDKDLVHWTFCVGLLFYRRCFFKPMYVNPYYIMTYQ